MALSTLSDSLGKYSGVFTAIGVATASYIALKLIYSLLRIFKIHFLAGPLGLGANLKKFGEWAGLFNLNFAIRNKIYPI